jgi:hypothetical protein
MFKHNKKMTFLKPLSDFLKMKTEATINNNKFGLKKLGQKGLQNP